MKVKTSELTDAALDWAVGKCRGVEARNNKTVFFVLFESESSEELEFDCFAENDAHAIEQCLDAYPGCSVDRVEWLEPFRPSESWAQGGPIIERGLIHTYPRFTAGRTEGGSDVYQQDGWAAYVTPPAFWVTPRPFTGPTPLIAAMRCYVASKLGDEVEVPDELVEGP